MYKQKLISLAGKARKYIAFTVFFNVVNLACSVAAVTAMALILQNAVHTTIEPERLCLYLGVIAIAVVIRFFSIRCSFSCSHKAAIAAKKHLRSEIYEKLLRIGPGFEEKVPTASAVQLGVEGVEQLQLYFGNYLPQLYYSMLAPVALFVFFSLINLKTALVLLLCAPLIPLMLFTIQRYVRKMNGKHWSDYTNLGQVFLESLHGLTTLKIYDADEEKNSELNSIAEGFRKTTMKVLRMQLNSITVMDLIAYGGAAAGILTGLYEMSEGRIPLWGMICILLLSSEFFIPLRILGSLFHVSMNGVAAGEKIFQLLALPEEEEGTEGMEGFGIETEALFFSYRRGKNVLEAISLDIPAGSFISVVGVSGSGKSTLAGILSGEKKHYGGSVRIGGKELNQLSREALMRNITVVDHNGYIFQGTVEENLRMGCPTATLQQMIDALVKVKLYDFVMAQGGLAMEIKEQGSNLSGGQRQRLVLARALLHNSNIYIFDEATSNIDMESENSIMDVIHSLKNHKTVILISHRLTSAAKADTVCFLKNGRMRGLGAHHYVYEKCKDYATLYDSQERIEKCFSERDLQAEDL